jgi:hypothetical protein
MKTRESVFVNELCLELKYCERCGGLWLRPVGSGEVFCAKCAREVAEPMRHRTEISYPRLPKGRGGFPHDDEEDSYEFDACAWPKSERDVRGGAA